MDDDETAAGGEVKAHGKVDCPDYTKVDSECIEERYKDSNWQSDPVMYDPELELDLSLIHI